MATAGGQKGTCSAKPRSAAVQSEPNIHKVYRTSVYLKNPLNLKPHRRMTVPVFPQAAKKVREIRQDRIGRNEYSEGVVDDTWQTAGSSGPVPRAACRARRHFTSLSSQLGEIELMRNRYSRQPLGRAVAVIFSGLMLASGVAGQPAQAAVPGAPRLLPEQTMIYARVENVREFREDLANSSVGRMLNDPKLRPFASDLYLQVSQIFEQIGSQLGISLDDLLDIPQGQFAVGLVAVDDSAARPADNEPRDDSPEAIRRRLAERQRELSKLGLLILIDAGERNATLDKILVQIEELVLRSGAVERSQTINGTQLRRWVSPSGGDTRMEYFQREGATLIGIGGPVAAEALARWDGRGTGNSLAESTDFAAVMTRCVGAQDTRPQITLFADPYRLAKRLVAQGGVAAAIGWQVAEELGVAKIRGIGASTFQGGEIFDDIAHAHILIDPPRDGIFSVLRPKAGDTNPPKWVPEDVTGYTTIGWRVDATYDGLARIVDRFQGEDAFKRQVEDQFEQRFGVDFRETIIAAVDDRFVVTQWLQPPVRINSSVSITAVKLKDPVAAAKTIEDLAGNLPNVRTDSIGARKLYVFPNRGGGGNAAISFSGPPDGEFPNALRQPTPCATIVDDWLLTSDSREFIERAIRANDGALPRLAALPEYDILASELGDQLGGEKPFLLTFGRASEVLRQVYELAKSDQTRSMLSSRNDGISRSFGELLRRNELPPFDEFKKYFAPTGSFAYDEPGGIHFGRFTLKP